MGVEVEYSSAMDKLVRVFWGWIRSHPLIVFTLCALAVAIVLGNQGVADFDARFPPDNNVPPDLRERVAWHRDENRTDAFIFGFLSALVFWPPGMAVIQFVKWVALRRTD